MSDDGRKKKPSDAVYVPWDAGKPPEIRMPEWYTNPAYPPQDLKTFTEVVGPKSAAREFGRELDQVFKEIIESVSREFTHRLGIPIGFTLREGRWVERPRSGDWYEYELGATIRGHVRVSAMALVQATGRPIGLRQNVGSPDDVREVAVPIEVLRNLEFQHDELRNQIAILKTREQAKDEALQAQNEELAKLRGATGESGLIQRLQLKLRTQYGDKERAVLKDFFVWLIEEKQARFPDEKKVDPNAVYSELVSGIRIAPDRAIEVEALLDEYLDTMEQKD